MMCLGNAQTSSPSHLESEAAQLRVIELFRRDFLSRYPDGIVISELEYMGRTTAAPNDPGPLQITGRPMINRILAALSSDFRRWVKNRDYRKCDALGIARDGAIAELVEVTTGTNAASAILQIMSKLAILRQTVNRIHNMSVDWRPSLWRPGPEQLFYPLTNGRAVELRYLCFMPTFQLAAPPGVILYEIHAVSRPRVPVPIPVPIPSDVRDRIRQLFRNWSDGLRGTFQGSEAWARRAIAEHPAIKTALRGMAFALGSAIAIGAIILILDPIPGDEIAAGMAATALLKYATQ